MPTISDVRELDRRAVLASIDIVRRVEPADLDRPTPCSAWRLGGLLAHMTVQHLGFRAASLGQGRDLAHWTTDPRETGPQAGDPVEDYVTAGHDVLAAFAAEGVLERSFALPEFSPTAEFSARQAIGFHFIDYVVHAWDVARSLGDPFVLDDDLAPAALRIAQAVPNGPERLVASAAFRPALPIPDPAGPPLDQILRLLGRSPTWPE